MTRRKSHKSFKKGGMVFSTIPPSILINAEREIIEYSNPARM
jgi:hypothetical protein